MTDAKICGLTTPETLDAAVRHGASHLGFVFFAASPRCLAFDAAPALTARIPPHVRRVGVFVNPDDALLDRAVQTAKLDTLQLHDTAPARAAEIKRRHALTLWSAIAVRTAADLAAANGYRGIADRILYDAKTPDDALPGGMGVRFDWTLLRGFAHPSPWALSGGLDSANLAEAVRITGATLVDVSSGVESAPGIKDVDKIAAFLKRASEL